jgi:hypothetical protein
MSIRRLMTVTSLAALCLGAGGCKSLAFLHTRGAAAARPALAGFDSVQISGPLDAQLTVGEAFEVRIEGDRAATAKVNARLAERTLVVDAPAAGGAAKEAVKLRVTLPRLQNLKVDGARVAATGPFGATLEVSASHAGTVHIDGAGGGRLLVEALDGSRVVLAGTADALYFTLTGGSRGDARQLKVRTAKVSLAGASRLDLNPEQALSGKATGGSRVALWNKPKRVAVATRDASDINYVQ